jgi:hypothetical protein
MKQIYTMIFGIVAAGVILLFIKEKYFRSVK